MNLIESSKQLDPLSDLEAITIPTLIRDSLQLVDFTPTPVFHYHHDTLE